MTRRAERITAVCVAGAATGMVVWSWRSPTFRLFFAWPTGGVWPNFVQAALWVAGAAFLGWFWRDHLGRGLVGWLGRHHAARSGKQLAEHHDRIVSNLKGEQIRVNQQLSELRGMVRSLHQRLDGRLWPRPTRPGSWPP